MRELKFRAWDKIENKMWFPDAIRFDLSQPVLSMKTNDIGVWVTFHVHEGLHDPLMECTGLKDVEGKEIYEGDIVLTGGVMRVVTVIKFSYPNHSLDEYSRRDGTCNVKILGNIYQNPELLKKWGLDE